MRVTFEEQRLSALTTDRPPDALVRPRRRTMSTSAPLMPGFSFAPYPDTPRV